MSPTCRVGFLAGLLLLAACGDARVSAEPVVVRDSAGVRVVVNRAPAWGGGDAWRLSAEPVLRIGELEGPAEYQLVRVVGAVRRSDGGIVVGDAGLHSLRFYDAAGRFVRSSGRKGLGPGEFEEMSSVRLLAGDSLLAFDWRQMRVSLFAPGGAFSRSATLRSGPIAVFPMPQLIGRTSDGSLLVGVGHSFGPGEVTDGVRRDSVDYLRYAPDGALLDTVAVLPSGESFVKTGYGRVGFTTAPLLFGKNAVHGLAGDRVVVGSNHAYELAVYSPEGVLEGLIRRKQEPRAVSDADFEAGVAASLDEMDREWRDRMEVVYRAMPRASTMPFYSALVVDDAGNLWVEDFRVPPQRTSTWTVFDADGRMLGGVAMPERFRPTHIGADFVLGVRRDELGVQYVQLFALKKAGSRPGASPVSRTVAPWLPHAKENGHPR